MPIYEVTSKPSSGVKTWKEGDVEREAIRITLLEAEDEATAKVRVNDLNRQVVEQERSKEDPHGAKLEEYRVTKVREVE